MIQVDAAEQHKELLEEEARRAKRGKKSKNEDDGNRQALFAIFVSFCSFCFLFLKFPLTSWQPECADPA
jgi:hypothetical protein